MSNPPSRTYKRSWKNLLINKDYQLRMTIVLVGISALLISGLGWWVMTQARTATEVAINNVEGTRCEKPAWMMEGAGGSRVVVDEISEMAPGAGIEDPAKDIAAPEDEDSPEGDEGETKPADEAKPAPPEGDAAKPDTGDAAKPEPADEEERPRVTITSSDMELSQPKGDAEPADEASRKDQEQRYHECELAKKTKVEDLKAGETLIFRVLVGLGLLMVFGLAFYGIKMTHKVAGPLFKVTLYLRKLRDNKYDTVYNLRKGDHLVDFYEHFKGAHAGVKGMQEEDIRQLKAILEVAEAEKLAEKSPELAAAIAELQKLLKDKEDSVV